MIGGETQLPVSVTLPPIRLCRVTPRRGARGKLRAARGSQALNGSLYTGPAVAIFPVLPSCFSVFFFSHPLYTPQSRLVIQVQGLSSRIHLPRNYTPEIPSLNTVFPAIELQESGKPSSIDSKKALLLSSLISFTMVKITGFTTRDVRFPVSHCNPPILLLYAIVVARLLTTLPDLPR